MGGKMKKKGKAGNAVNYITRNQALKKLQVNLKQFRRLCILKGIYPREPKKKVHGRDKTYYYAKDIAFLAHEPMLQTMREIKTHTRKMTKARMKGDHTKLKLLLESKPDYSLDHLVKERYPSFIDAVRDMDDALSTLAIFATFPATNKIEEHRTIACAKLLLEFQTYLIKSHALRKVFFSIKGTYLQAEVFGQEVTWLLPHKFSQEVPIDVDFRVLGSFLEFYQTQVHFINYKLFTSLGFVYPPRLDTALDNVDAGLSAIILERSGPNGEVKRIQGPEKAAAAPGKRKGGLDAMVKEIARADNGEDQDDDGAVEGVEDLDTQVQGDSASEVDEMETEDGAKLIFKGLKFFLSREVPMRLLEFAIRSLGGAVGFEGQGSPFVETNESITHQVVDRGYQRHQFLDREYVQPQWVADCINAQIVIPVEKYMPGLLPPPHLSPFVNDEEEGYVPEQRKYILQLQGKEVPEEDEDEDDDEEEAEDKASEIGEDSDEEPEAATLAEQYEAELQEEVEGTDAKKRKRMSESKKAAKAHKAEEERAKMMMPKKDRRLYEKIQYAAGRKQDKVDRLKKKRKAASQPE